MSISSPHPSDIANLTSYRMREYDRVLASLKHAHARHQNGPAILSLVNELACLAETILRYRCDESGEPLSTGQVRIDQFFRDLTAGIDRIARTNGTLSPCFLDLVSLLPVEVARAAA